MTQEQAPNNRKKWIFIVGILGVLLAVGSGWWWFYSNGKVSTEDARVKSNIINVSSKVSGQVEEVLVKEGDAVHAGQVLAKIDNKALQIQLEQAQANLASSQAKLASLQAGNRPQQIAQAAASAEQATANLDNARKNYERAESLYNDGAMSAQQRDSTFTALKVAEAQYQAAVQGYSLASEGAAEQDIKFAEAQVAQAAAAVKNAQLQLDNSTITAPAEGIVAKAAIDSGEMIAAGQTLFSLTNPTESWVEANIEETDIGKIEIGQQVNLKIDAYPGKIFKGEVFEVGAATGSQFALLPSENASGNFTKVTQRLSVKIKVADTAGFVLKPGMSAVIDIYIK